MAEIFLPDNIDEMIDEAGKPALPEGKYLAVIMGGEAKISDNGKFSYGVNWKLLVNMNPASLSEGWDTEAGTLEVNYYTYIGKYQGGKLTDTDKGWAFTKLLKVLGVTGLRKLDTADQMFRQIGVIVEHVPGKDDREAMKADPSHVPDQLYVGIKTVFSYTVGDAVCPPLAFLADAHEASGEPDEDEIADNAASEAEETEPKAEPTAEGETSEEKPKRKKKTEPEPSAW